MERWLIEQDVINVIILYVRYFKPRETTISPDQCTEHSLDFVSALHFSLVPFPFLYEKLNILPFAHLRKLHISKNLGQVLEPFLQAVSGSEDLGHLGSGSNLVKPESNSPNWFKQESHPTPLPPNRLWVNATCNMALGAHFPRIPGPFPNTEWGWVEMPSNFFRVVRG